jgi:hypothetical protein
LQRKEQQQVNSRAAAIDDFRADDTSLYEQYIPTLQLTLDQVGVRYELNKGNAVDEIIQLQTLLMRYLYTKLYNDAKQYGKFKFDKAFNHKFVGIFYRVRETKPFAGPKNNIPFSTSGLSCYFALEQIYHAYQRHVADNNSAEQTYVTQYDQYVNQQQLDDERALYLLENTLKMVRARMQNGGRRTRKHIKRRK